MKKGWKRVQTLARVVWRKVVYARDAWTCQWPDCGRKPPAVKIEAHHIRTWARFPSLRFDLNNGITLCSEHHEHVTYREDQFVALFDGILKGRGALWASKTQRSLKDRMRRKVLSLRRARTAGRCSRRRRSRTGRRN